MTLAFEALSLAQHGFAIFPLQPREKKPYGHSTGLHAATIDHLMVARWWATRETLPKKDDAPASVVIRVRPDSNIGAATGPASGFWVLDLDGPTAEEGLAALVAVHGDLPLTPEQITGGGRQLLFAWDDAYPIRNSASRIGPKIDVRGDGGYIVVAPSIHPGKPEEGIPPGRVYTWVDGRSPFDIPFAAAPEWLLKAAMPAPEAEHKPPSQPRTVMAGRASRYGEATLSTTCARIAGTPPGGQNEALFGYAAFIGARIAGGEIDHAYGRDALIDAGLRMTPRGKPWTRKEVEATVDRGLDKGLQHPTSAPERPAFQPAQRYAPRVAPSAAQKAVDIRSARELWDAARPADCGLFRSWLRVHGLDADGLPQALGRLRAYQRAPIGEGTGPAVLLPLTSSPDGEPEALAVLPLNPRSDGLAEFVGDPAGRVAVLVPWGAGGDVVVTTDFQDAWALGSSAVEAEHDMGVVIAPLRTTLAGAALGDRWGRVDTRTPHLDPDSPPWTVAGVGTAFVAIRGDLENPPLRSRKAWGGTARVDLQGEAAARFYGGLAEQGWRKAGANQVRILRPSAGARGFNAGRSGGGRVVADKDNPFGDLVTEVPGGVSPEEMAGFPLNDLGNAMRLILLAGGAVRKDGFVDAKHSRLLFQLGGGWVGFNGKYWDRKHGEDLARRLAHETSRLIPALWDHVKDRVPPKDFFRFANDTGSAGKTSAMLRQAQSYLTVEIDVFDRDPMAINCLNGTIKMRWTRPADGKPGKFEVRLQPHEPADRITRCTTVAYDKAAKAPLYEKVAKESLGDPEERAHFKRALGYCTTGRTEEQAFFLAQGRGRDGKSTLLDAARETLGSYAVAASPQTFLEGGIQNGSGPSPDLIALSGDVRLAVLSEPPRGAKLNEGRLKAWTSGTPIPARDLNAKPIEFRPIAKLFWECNAFPVARGDDDGIWRRIYPALFRRQVPKDQIDRTLPGKLLEQRAGILNWLIEGVGDWCERGLDQPESYRAALEDYRKASSPFGDWLGERCLTGEAATGQRELSGDLYASFKEWSEEQGHEKIMSTRAFGDALRDRQVALAGKDAGGRKYRGPIRLKTLEERAADNAASPVPAPIAPPVGAGGPESADAFPDVYPDMDEVWPVDPDAEDEL